VRTTPEQRPLEKPAAQGDAKQNQKSSKTQNKSLERASSTRTRSSCCTIITTAPESTQGSAKTKTCHMILDKTLQVCQNKNVTFSQICATDKMHNTR